jgi:hypothetical protein
MQLEGNAFGSTGKEEKVVALVQNAHPATM